MIRIYVMLGMRLSSFLSISPVKLWVRNPFMARFTRCNFLWKCLSVTCSRSVVFSGYSGFLHQQNWPPQYNWIILESDVNVKPSPIYIILTLFGLIFRRIYIYIYMSETVWEVDLWADKCLFSLDGIWTHTIDTLQHQSLILMSSTLDPTAISVNRLALCPAP